MGLSEQSNPQAETTAVRTGPRQYAATSELGGELTIGFGPGEFTPGDLLKLAILGCNALSSEARFIAALGEDVKLDGSVTADFSQEENRFTAFHVSLTPDLSGLDAEEREHLLDRAARAVQRQCTISRTVEHGAKTDLEIDGTAV